MQRKYFLFILINFSFSFASFCQSKHALLFAIGNYQYWKKISSLHDIPLMETALKNQGFKDITIIRDSLATVKGINKALEEFYNKLQPGDIALIHFSAHGEQIEDDNGDETDGLDEAIVGYDAALPPDKLVSATELIRLQAGYLRDDQFGNYIDRLRTKLGNKGDVIVFMDLCHSGSGTRGTAKVRGGERPLISANFKIDNFKQEKEPGFYKDLPGERGASDNHASYIVFSAAESTEIDYETTDDDGNSVGSLSYAISKAFAGIGEKSSTYRTLFTAIQTVMNYKSANQHPVMEGSGTDRKLWAGTFVKQLPYFEIARVSGNEITVSAGKFQGLDSGTIISLYAAGTVDTSTSIPLSRGIVTKATGFNSEVALDKDPKLLHPNGGWVFINQPFYNTQPLKISFIAGKNGFNEAEIDRFKKSLLALPLVRFTKKPELIIIKGSAFDSIRVAASGYLFAVVKGGTEDPAQLNTALRQYIQYKFLQGLDIHDEAASLDISILPLKNGIVDTSTKKNLTATPEFQDGDSLVLLVENKGDEDLYFNILDLEPSGKINKIAPYKDKNIYPDDLLVQAHSVHLFDKYPIHVYPPFGTEIFKIFVSRQKIDLEDIANTTGAVTRNRLSVLERLFVNSYHAGTRGQETTSIAGTDGSCFNLLFIIKPKLNVP